MLKGEMPWAGQFKWQRPAEILLSDNSHLYCTADVFQHSQNKSPSEGFPRLASSHILTHLFLSNTFQNILS